MRYIAWSICLALGANMFGGDGRLPTEEAQRYAKICVEKAGKKNAQIRMDADPEKALAVRGEGGGAMAVPDRSLTQEKLAKLGPDIMPVGQLWLRKWTLVSAGKPIPESQLRMIKITVDGMKKPMPLFLLGVRKKDDKAELVVYAKANEPLAVVPLKTIDFIPEFPIELEWTRGENLVDPLTLKIMGKYQTELFITRSGK